MSLRVIFRAAARIEFEEATTWYDKERHGLGEEFLREIDEVIFRVAEKPERFPLIFSDVRKAVAKRFPYAIFFRVRGVSLVILAVFHGRRDPTIWRRRA